MNLWYLIVFLFFLWLGLFVYDHWQNIDNHFIQKDYKEHTYLISRWGMCHHPECECQTKGELK